METERIIRALDPPRSRQDLAAASIEAVMSNDPSCFEALTRHLGSAEFLGRLDDLGDPSFKTYHLRRLFSALEEYPSALTRDLCIAVAASSAFVDDPFRMNFLLPALAAVRPMTAAVAVVVRRSNPDGFYGVNAPLVVRNRSPIALDLFEEMIRDAEVEAASRVDALHTSVLPYRTDLSVLQLCARLLDARLDEAVRVGVVETLFDLQPGTWFGVARTPPQPPPWDTASSEALSLAVSIGEGQLRVAELPALTRDAVEQTASEIRTILAQRTVP